MSTSRRSSSGPPSSSPSEEKGATGTRGASPDGAAVAKPTPLTRYQRVLFVFLGVATFFEGYDLFALAQILPNLRADLELTTAQGGALVAVANVGTVLAYLLVYRADRWGRRRVLTITIAGYTTFSFLTALAFDAWSFAAFQLFARIFLIGEYAVAMVYAAEEYPADRRGMVIGVIQACSSLGAIVCAGTVPLLLETPLGWRSVYLIGTIPLLVVAVARRSLRETTRFARDGSGETSTSFLRILRGPYRRRVLQLGTIWALTFVCTQNAVVFWKEFALSERGLTDAQVGAMLTIASLGSMPFVFAAGKLLDVLGRRRGAALIFGLTAVGTFSSYTVQSEGALTLALAMGILGTSAVLPVLNAFTTELFPTTLRSEAFAWSNNLIGRGAYLMSPLAIGRAAEAVGWGAAVRATALFPLLALVLILCWLPETRGRELEETAAL